ncbi:hypothetical protein [Cellulomonas palmilytica]|uniref:hypothetical protein n=1 Tax=Cellulomonas palmilytica TaxID=2608402 RepID=UPI001F225AA9|nr:hypothetical protein [Cellulomonas palmilytica]UJP39962.1 hypothetical protein F1D97_17100 [Cellulomonas palmilytica]
MSVGALSLSPSSQRRRITDLVAAGLVVTGLVAAGLVVTGLVVTGLVVADPVG